MHILARSFYQRNTQEVAHDLIGKILVRKIGAHEIQCIIAETEAYPSDDPASHAFRGKTTRNSPLFGPVGHCYIYFSYGLHFCLNLVSYNTKLPAGGVLIRALIPLCGKKLIEENTGKKTEYITGPGNVCKGLNVTFNQQSTDVTNHSSVMYVTQGIIVPENFISHTKRIGISKAQDVSWRFLLDRKKSASHIEALRCTE